MSHKLFPNNNDLYERYSELKSNDPYKAKRDKFIFNYNRQDWKRTNNPVCTKADPNLGQFKSKIDAAMNTFINVLTERNAWVKIIPKYANSGQTKNFSDKISSSFHKHFIRPWEDRFFTEVYCAMDMVFYGKACEHWPSAGCLYTENVPIEKVFPDSNASLNTKQWNYCFIEKDFTLAELWSIYEAGTGENEADQDFNREFLKDILDRPDHYSSIQLTESAKEIKGDISTSARDGLVTLVYAYIKENFKKKEKKVNLYVFPAEPKEYVKGKTGNASDKPDVKVLLEKKEYAECISEVVAIRAFQLSRKFWKFNSFAQQIYLSTMIYDKSMSLVLRAAKRNCIVYLKSGSPESQKKLIKQTDDEMQIVDSDVEYMQTGQNANIRELVEVTRQVVIETENGQNLAQAPGSQNVKGYAITAQEAQMRSQKIGEAESLNIKILMNGDVKLYKEIYRRAMEGDSEKSTKALDAFKQDMKEANIDPEFYKMDNVYFVPSFLNGGSQESRVRNSEAVFRALSINPTSPGQVKAQKDLIGALVGVEAIEDYISDKMAADPIFQKVGQENEALDNPHVNPSNVPVMPDDKHLMEIPIHLADYEVKLTQAGRMIEQSQSLNIPARKMLALSIAANLIIAQDNKGAHIQAHFQASMNSKENQQVSKPMMDKFSQLQSMQDKMTNQIVQLNEELDKILAESGIRDAELNHKKQMFALEEGHAKTMADLKTGQAVEKNQSAEEQRQAKSQASMEQTALKQASAEEKAKLDIQHQQTKNELDQQKEAAKIVSSSANTGPA